MTDPDDFDDDDGPRLGWAGAAALTIVAAVVLLIAAKFVRTL